MPKEIINEDFEFPPEFEHRKETEVQHVRGAPEPVEIETPEVEVEIIDDTPEEDRGRKPLQAEDDQEQEEELDNYSEKVQKRINQINHKYHDERREKERLAREHAEAVRIAQAIYEENERLKSTLTWGQQEYTKVAEGQLEYAQKLAQDKFRKAFESGDTEGVLEAQNELSALAVQKSQLQTFGPPMPPAQEPVYQQPLQNIQNPVYNNVNPAPEPAPRDYKAEDWAARNPWFGKDKEMTAFAYGLHEKLVEDGVDPTSDDYYQKVDARLRKVFPEKFTSPKKTSNVASVGRTTAPKKVALTASEMAIAKRLGVTPERYALYKQKGATVNG